MTLNFCKFRVQCLGRGVPLPSRLEDLGERRELPQRGPGQSPGRQRILGIFHGLIKLSSRNNALRSLRYCQV